MEESQEIKTDKQHKNNFDWLNEYKWQKGQSGNPAGRPKEKTLKEFARKFLANMSEEGRIEYLKKVKPEIIWEMAEGKAKQDIDLKASHSFADVLNEVENGNRGQTTSNENIGQVVAHIPTIQNQEQKQGIGNIPPQQSTNPLPSEQVVEKYNPQEPPAGVYD